MSTSLPQICSRCRKLKSASLGRFHWSRVKYHRRIFTCFECLGKTEVNRLRRKNQETPIEAEVREALQDSGVKAVAEFSMGPFIFDFVISRLRAIIEVDSASYHRTPRQKRVDEAKTAWARKNNWRLCRVSPPDVRQQTLNLVVRLGQEIS